PGMTQWGTAAADPSPSGEGGLATARSGGAQGREQCSADHAAVATRFWVSSGRPGSPPGACGATLP
ncbi:MAG: hypothetical protein KF735_20915, partial [Chelatococcus sp.]|uniref:hypothetical protein n=1 Tax=Chelatococcus sp. TaxID=1953771 RepID=UPI0025B7AC59